MTKPGNDKVRQQDARVMRDFENMFSDWAVVEETDEMAALVCKLRTNERDLQGQWAKLEPKPATSMLWHLVAGDVDEAQAWYDAPQPLEELCERALRLRGTVGAPARAVMRERARILLHAMGPRRALPQEGADLLGMWAEATRLEPHVRLNVDVARWRTAEDWLPFTGMSRRFIDGPKPLPAGAETARPENIPALVEDLIAFVNESGLTPEVTAAHARHLFVYIHPFVDGNGHTSRMLLCDLLMRAGYAAPTLVSYVDSAKLHRREWSSQLRSVLLGESEANELVSLQLRTLLEAQARLLGRLQRISSSTPSY